MRLTPLWYQAGEYAAEVDRQLIGALFPGGGVVGMGLSIVANSRNVMIAAGKCGVLLGDGTAVLCVETGGEQVQIATSPPTGQNRRDLIVVRPREGANVDFIFDIIEGTPAAPGAALTPATPAGTFALGHVTAVGGQAFLATGDLSVDSREGAGTAGSQIGYAETTTGHTGITTVMADLNGLNTGLFRIPSRRRVELLATVVFQKNAPDTSQWIQMHIARQDNQAMAQAYEWLPAPGWVTVTLTRWITLDPGNHQFKCRAQTGGGFLNMMGAVNHMIGVRDLGPA